MKLGFFIMPVHPLTRNYAETLNEIAKLSCLADKLGYSEGYCGEHLTDLAENIPSSLTFVGSLAGFTSQIRLGTAVANLPFSHPLLLATQAALVDNLLGGRLMFGIGAGVLRTDMEAMELLDADRNAMFAEAIDHIVALWTGEAPYDLEGKYWNISTAKTRWPEIGLGDVVKPFQEPHPPILGTATDPYSKGLVALGRRGGGRSLRISPSQLAAQPVEAIRQRLRRRRPSRQSGQLARRAFDLCCRRRQDGARLWRRRRQEPVSFLYEFSSPRS